MMKKIQLPLLTLSLFSLPAMAHPGHIAEAGFHNSFMAGFMHPLTGLDHLLAMLMAGLLIAHLGKRQLMGSAALLLLALLAGTALGAVLGGSALVEMLVFASCLLVAACLVKKHLSSITARSTSMLISSVFILHGWAHGSELPAEQASLFIAGYLVAAVALLFTGVGVMRIASYIKAKHNLLETA